MWKNYTIILMLIPITLVMHVGLKMLFGWWTGDWKAAIWQSASFGVAILIAFAYYRRGEQRRAAAAQRSATEKTL